MKIKLFSSAIFAAVLPVTALSSIATEQVFEEMRQPLSSKSSYQQQVDHRPVQNTLGQSYAMTQAFNHIAQETDHVTQHPVKDDQTSRNDTPLDW